MTSSNFEQDDMEQLRSLFSGLKLNASQAARVAGVQRPVIATWASRHASAGFPSALVQDAVSRETLYDAFEFVVWAAARPKAKRSFEQMLVQAAVESSVAPALEKKFELQQLVRSLMTLVLAYRVVEPVVEERLPSLLRRYALASPHTVRNLEPFLLKVVPEDLELLRCSAYVIARFSDDLLSDVQLFSSLLMGRQKLGEQISADLGSFLRSVSTRFSGDVRLHFASGLDSALTVQLTQNIALSQDVRRSLQVTSASSEAGERDFARVLSLLADEELLLLSEHSAFEQKPALVFVVLPLAKSSVDARKQWSVVEDLLLDLPLGVPVFVLGRAEVLGASFEVGEGVPQQSVLETGHLLALISCGQRQLVTESGATLMLGIFENRRVDASAQTPLVALLDLSEKLGPFHREVQEEALHDIESLAFENRQSLVRSAFGEHRLLSGVRVPWQDIQELGFDVALESSARSSGASQTVQGIGQKVEFVNGAVYEPFSLSWRVSPISGASTKTLGAAREDGGLRRVAGMTAQKLSDLALVSSDMGSVRVVDSKALEFFRRSGVLPDSYDSLSAVVLQDLELAQEGDLLVLEGASPVVFAVHSGLVVAKSPVFILRRILPDYVKLNFRLDAFAGLVQAALDAQVQDGVTKASWGKARISQELLNAVLNDVSNEQVDALDQQLKKVRLQKHFLRDQLRALDSLERDTLSGLAGGSIRFSG